MMKSSGSRTIFSEFVTRKADECRWFLNDHERWEPVTDGPMSEQLERMDLPPIGEQKSLETPALEGVLALAQTETNSYEWQGKLRGAAGQIRIIVRTRTPRRVSLLMN